MALYPQVEFDLSFMRTGLRAGELNKGELTLRVLDASIERVEHVDLHIACVGRAEVPKVVGIGIQTWTRPIAEISSRVPLPSVLAHGHHTFPVEIQVPATLPANIEKGDWSILTTARIRLSVDWAHDPAVDMPLDVVPAQQQHAHESVVVRSPRNFYQADLLEVSLASNVVRIGEPLTGAIALRSSSPDDYTVTVKLRNLLLASGHAVDSYAPVLEIPKRNLLGGSAVSFSIPTGPLCPLVRTDCMIAEASLQVAVATFFHSATFDVPVVIAPSNARITGTTALHTVGNDRLTAAAKEIARGTPLRAAVALPDLAEGEVAFIWVTIFDALVDGHFGVGAVLRFPSLCMGLHARTIVESFAEASTPHGYDEQFGIRFDTKTIAIKERAAATFLKDVLRELREWTTLEFSDTELRVTTAMATSSTKALVEFAQFACAFATKFANAIRALPFPEAMAAWAPAWRAAEVQERALLVASGPTLHRIKREVRVSNGEVRAFGATLDVLWTRAGERTRLVLLVELGEDLHKHTKVLSSPLLAPARALFPEISLGTDGVIELARDGGDLSPANNLPALDTVIAWYLEVRGERVVANTPYR
jgi:hypothetical protein